jgi:hypothetical protein
VITEKTSFIGRFYGTAGDPVNQFIRANPSKAYCLIYLRHMGLSIRINNTTFR